MDARLTLKPGQPGTKKLMQAHGDRLVRVRYRYDRDLRKRFKTVELIIEENDWEPPEQIPDAAIVGVRIDFDEKALQARIKKAGGKWEPTGRLWHLRYIDAVKMGLKSRVVKAINNVEGDS